MNTIVACATGADPAALAVLRLRGPGALAIGRALCGDRSLRRDRLMELVQLKDARGVIDRCLAVAFFAPRSFTGEDVVEFHLHGGPGLIQVALEACVRQGARRAEPGEFTRRAYLSGKLDLVEAEAIAARVQAASERAARLSEAGVAGRLSHFARAMERTLTEQRAHVEGWLDFDPEELGDNDRKPLIQAIRAASDRLERAAQTGADRAPFENPIVLLAVPSTQANQACLMRSSVTNGRWLATAGTTRDWIEAPHPPVGADPPARLGGSTRGADQVDAGIRRAQAWQQADLILRAPAGEAANAPAGAVCSTPSAMKAEAVCGLGTQRRGDRCAPAMLDERLFGGRSPTPRPA